ncbi:MAG TPA: EAL domain-containing protein [Steroidobacteraceae bacterium]|nr:EAL domain-containing protein [Steroidobacteraceae bacterium]
MPPPATIGPASMRLGAILLALCMAIIAGSAGTIVYLYLDVSQLEAVTVAIATLMALALYNAVSGRVGLRSVAGRQLAELSQGGADLARQVAEMGRRLAAVEEKIETALDRTRAVTDPLAVEIGELSTLVKRLAETVAAHQAGIEALTPIFPKSQETPASVISTSPLGPTSGAPDRRAASSDLAVKAVTADRTDLEPDAIRDAMDSNRIDLYLQPIVTLPQRKVRYYEAMPRLRNKTGDILSASNFVPHAESGGLMPQIDLLVIFRCIRVLRRLLLKNRQIGLFCNLSSTTLTDGSVFPRLLDFMAANRAIAPSLLFQFTHGAVRDMGTIEHESLAALSEHGLRFSMDHVTSLHFEPGELAKRGFQYIKVHADMLLKTVRPAPTDVHPASLSDLLGRFGIDLIVDRIEHEGSVIDLLDHDVRFGQGPLFSPPRPVRGEALQANPEHPGAGGHGAVASRAAQSSGPARTPFASDADQAGPGTIA